MNICFFEYGVPGQVRTLIGTGRPKTKIISLYFNTLECAAADALANRTAEIVSGADTFENRVKRGLYPKHSHLHEEDQPAVIQRFARKVTAI